MTGVLNKKPERSFLKDSIIYGLSSIFTLGVGFLLIPLYTHALSTADFGLYEIFNQTANILFIFVYMGTINSFVRFYFDDDSLAWKKKVTATSVVFNLSSFALVALTVIIFRDIIVFDLIKDERANYYLDLLLIWMFCEMLYSIGTTFLQINKLPGYFLTAHVVRAVIFVSLNTYFLIYREEGIQGILTSNIIAAGLYGVSFLLFCFAWTRLNISFSLLRQLLSYGLPYLPAALFIFVVNGGERFFLNHYAGLSEVGIYSLASKIGLIGTLLLSQAFSKVWGPYVFDKYKEPGGDTEIANIYHNYAKLLVVLALGVALAGPVLIPFISAPEFNGAGTMISLVCIAAIIQGLSFAADTGLLIAKKTKYKMLIAFYGAIAAIVANFVFTANFGMVGAAIASACGWFTILLGNIHFSNKFYRLPIRWLQIAKGTFLAVIAYLGFFIALKMVEFESNLYNTVYILFLATVTFCCFMLAAFKYRFIDKQDLSVVRNLVRKLMPIKWKFHGKKLLLAKLLYGHFSPIRWILPRHSFKFPVIVTYHRIYDCPDDYPMTRNVINSGPELFEQQVAFFKEHFNVINFRDLDKAEREGKPLPPNSLIITFDDGYFDNHTYALPILVKYGLTATVFISTDFIDTGKPFWVDLLAYQIFTMPEGELSLLGGKHKFSVKAGKRNEVRVKIGSLCGSVGKALHEQILKEVGQQTGIDAIPEKYLKHCRPMTWSEAKELHEAGIELGAHTISHCFLDQLEVSEIDYELKESKRRIEEKTGCEVISMAYPSGKFSDKVLDCVAKADYKYSCAFNNRFDKNIQSINPMALSRITVDKNMAPSLFQGQLFLPKLFLK